jgi:hypothetical protein
LQVLPAVAPHNPSAEVSRETVGRGAAEVLLIVAEAEMDGWVPHFPKRGLQPVPQWSALRPHHPD